MIEQLRPIIFPSLDKAREAIAQIGADGRRVELMARKSMHRCVYIPRISVHAAVILKQEMLAKGGEAVLPWHALCLRGDETRVILCGTLRQFENVCQTLKEQPFGLPELAARLLEVLRSSVGENGPSVFDVGGERLPIGERTYVMGAINMTPDSFSGDGLAGNVVGAVERAEQMLIDGADVLDIGGESTRPGSQSIPVDEETRRVVPAVREMVKRLRARVSIDTRHADVARAAIDAGAVMVNDVSALTDDPNMRGVCASAGVAVCLMHKRGEPATMQEHIEYAEDVVTDVAMYLKNRAEDAMAAGIKPSSILVDPGIGFGKTVAHNLEILSRLDEIRTLTTMPILVGASRKSFIGETLGVPVTERLEGTGASVACAIARGADFVRVHDVKEMTRVCRMTDAILRRSTGIGSSSQE